MALRLVQMGQGDPRPLVLAFLVSGELDAKLRAAFGPRCCIVADGLAKGPMMAEILEFAHTHAKLRHVSRFALIGYSAGCQRVGALCLEGVEADAYLLADGTHASLPPEKSQIEWLRRLVDDARAGRILVVATHTMQTYTEQLPVGKAFCSTVTVLRMATGWELERAGPPESPVVTNEGALWVYSYASAAIDAPAHVTQLVRVVPELAARHLGPWLGGHDTRVAEERAPTLPIQAIGLALTLWLSSGDR